MHVEKQNQPTDFRLYLCEELVQRCKKNPKYSLRAFARMLQIEPSFLSKLLSGKRSLTNQSIGRLGEQLGLSPEEIFNFQSTLHPTATTTISEEYKQLTMDAFQVISEWHHFAILELLQVKHFQPSIRWIAQALNIHSTEAQLAIERLERLGMLKKQEDGWRSQGNNSTLKLATSTASLRALQKQILQKAIDALENIPPELRDQTGMTVAIDSTLLPEAKERIKKFRRNLCSFLQTNRNCDEVYQLSISFFPLTEAKKFSKQQKKGEKNNEPH